ncbi:uncharacterized protein N7515_002224 [Penicillium bovifimosum]|uniref:Purine nucleoside permease n=1 Tax=Penicillium bovifimosum TaxID=126998 RepID=A0A9W9HB65_9EURO|nr:uncharacterized protein N7515_002224 [Penicillium bovifimosum]KAJ5143437.1 hypothetical protein N7515_002224 [Penicillium bovifimosum]
MNLKQALTASLLLAGSSLCAGAIVNIDKAPHKTIAPKVFIVSMFAPEAEAWWNIPEFNLLAHNISVPGLSPLFPEVHCTKDHEICQLITGEGEINAATTTYFFIAGIAGVSPRTATIGSAMFARYAVQVALQYEIDIRELNSNASTGYIAQGTDSPGQYPTNIYGTEVFELNADLRTVAANFARKANLSDSATAQAYRAHYKTPSGKYKAGTLAPGVVECDVATTDVYFSGNILGDTFENTTKLWTNGTGEYCATAQEDNATLEALLRSSMHKRTDFSRIIAMRTGSDFDRPYPGASAEYNLFEADQGAFGPAIENLYVAGIKVVQGILDGWHHTFAHGVQASNYVGDIFGSLGGVPDFGPGRKQALVEGGNLKKHSRVNLFRKTCK